MIRFVIGLLMVYGAVGGMDADPAGTNFAAQIGLAMLGLALMYFGSRKLQ